VQLTKEGCGIILNKEQAFANGSLNVLSREENAFLDLWTVTRAHVFAGCGYSTMAMAAYEIHQRRLNEWRNSPIEAVRNAANAIVDPLMIGDVQYAGGHGGLCGRVTREWLDAHHSSKSCVI
jgi:hypothetical protein